MSASGAGLFVEVRVAAAVADDPEQAKKLIEVCPVDIFEASAAGDLAISLDNVDECTLCELCLAVGEPGAVRVLKLYDEGAELKRGLSGRVSGSSAPAAWTIRPPVTWMRPPPIRS